MDPAEQPRNAHDRVEQPRCDKTANCEPAAVVVGQLRRSLGWLVWAVMLTAAALLVLAAVDFGSLINYYGFDTALLSGAFIAAVVLGFTLGWWARSLLGR